MGILGEIRYVLLCKRCSLNAYAVYRGQFILWLAYAIIGVFFTYASISIIYGISSGIPGWNYYQMLALSATSTMLLGFVEIFVFLNAVNWQLLDGVYDIYFTMPYSKLGVILARSGSFNTSIGSILGGILMFAYAIMHLNIAISSLLGYLVLFAFGFFGFLVFYAMLGVALYHAAKSRNTGYAARHVLQSASTYPISIYGLSGQLFFSLLLPVGFAYYYPTEVLLHSSPYVFLFSLAGSVIVGFVSYNLFNVLIKKYTGAGG